MRVQISGKEQLPPLNEVFSIHWPEESRRLVMLENGLLKNQPCSLQKLSKVEIRNQKLFKGNLQIENSRLGKVK